MKKVVVISLFLINATNSLFCAADAKPSVPTVAKCRLLVASATDQGARNTMEDYFYNDLENKFFGVYDGHGGHKIAQWAQEGFHTTLYDAEQEFSDTKIAIEASFITFNDCIKGQAYNQGTTATIALVRNDRLYVANVGDSRAVLSVNGKAEQASIDHNPHLLLAEKTRIEANGVWRIKYLSSAPNTIPFLDKANETDKRKIYTTSRIQRTNIPPRSNCGLSVSRALGDHFFEGAVIANPDIHIRKLDGTEDFLIIASDGLWTIMSNQAAVDLIKQWLSDGQTLEQCAICLVEKAVRIWEHDNVTVTIVLFNHDNNVEPSNLN